MCPANHHPGVDREARVGGVSNNIIDFPQRDELPLGLQRALKPVWCPEYAYHVIQGRGVPYWTRREILCRFDPDKRPGAPQFVDIPWGDQPRLTRAAPIPDVDVAQFDWEAFERKAAAS
jgi:hypothetical protein